MKDFESFMTASLIPSQSGGSQILVDLPSIFDNKFSRIVHQMEMIGYARMYDEVIPNLSRWTRVRHVPQGDKWYSAVDKLQGQAYGDKLNDDEGWSIKFDDMTF